MVSSLTDIHFAEHGFTSSLISDSSGTYSGPLYHRDPVQALIRQIDKANSDNCLFLHTQRTYTNHAQGISHPMHTSLALRLQTYVKERVMCSENDSVIWNDNDLSLPLSFVGKLQLFSDKTCTTLKASAAVEYPVHLTLFNFSLPLRRNLISSGLTIIGYLLVTTIDSPDTSTDAISIASFAKSRSYRLSLLHNSLTHVLSPLSQSTNEGFLCKDAKNTSRTCFPIISSYSCDFPEEKDISSVVAGATTKFPSHRCLILASILAFTTPHPPRSIHQTVQARQDATSFLLQSEQHAIAGRPAQARNCKALSKQKTSNLSI